MYVKQLDHLNLTVANLEETIRFYNVVFGFEVVEEGAREEGPWAIIRSGDALLCIFESNRLPPARFRQDGQEQHVIYHFGFRLTDREGWLNKVEEHQLELLHGGEQVYPHSSSWYVLDPTGYTIELVLWKEDEISFADVA
ncbi:MAG: VOC family protein [Myxococcota bacterium]|nr:VOC family protein [Myxococcota bacterium]